MGLQNKTMNLLTQHIMEQLIEQLIPPKLLQKGGPSLAEILEELEVIYGANILEIQIM